MTNQLIMSRTPNRWGEEEAGKNLRGMQGALLRAPPFFKIDHQGRIQKIQKEGA